MSNIVRSQRASALLAVILVLIMLSFLGAGVLAIGVAEARHSAREEKMLQAHYIARSGADVVGEHIGNLLAGTFDGDSFLSTFHSTADGSLLAGTTTENLGEGNFRVRVRRESEERIVIESTGRVPYAVSSKSSGYVDALVTLSMLCIAPSEPPAPEDPPCHLFVREYWSD